jgi:hypothetical protein
MIRAQDVVGETLDDARRNDADPHLDPFAPTHVRYTIDPWVAIVTQGSIDSLEGVRTLTSDTSLTLMRASGLAFFRSEISCLRSSME